jgi:hypothetical protein
MYAPETILGASPLHFFRYAYLPEGHDIIVQTKRSGYFVNGMVGAKAYRTFP